MCLFAVAAAGCGSNTSADSTAKTHHTGTAESTDIATSRSAEAGERAIREMYRDLDADFAALDSDGYCAHFTAEVRRFDFLETAEMMGTELEAGKDPCQSIVEDLRNLDGPVSQTTTIETIDIGGEAARVTGSVTSEGSRKFAYAAQLILRDGTWLIAQENQPHA
jgi:hypothetical protein